MTALRFLGTGLHKTTVHHYSVQTDHFSFKAVKIRWRRPKSITFINSCHVTYHVATRMEPKRKLSSIFRSLGSVGSVKKQKQHSVTNQF